MPKVLIGKRRNFIIKHEGDVETFSQVLPLNVQFELTDYVLEVYEFAKGLVNKDSHYLDIAYTICTDKNGLNPISIPNRTLVQLGTSEESGEAKIHVKIEDCKITSIVINVGKKTMSNENVVDDSTIKNDEGIKKLIEKIIEANSISSVTPTTAYEKAFIQAMKGALRRGRYLLDTGRLLMYHNT